MRHYNKKLLQKKKERNYVGLREFDGDDAFLLIVKYWLFFVTSSYFLRGRYLKIHLNLFRSCISDKFFHKCLKNQFHHLRSTEKRFTVQFWQVFNIFQRYFLKSSTFFVLCKKILIISCCLTKQYRFYNFMCMSRC